MMEKEAQGLVLLTARLRECGSRVEVEVEVVVVEVEVEVDVVAHKSGTINIFPRGRHSGPGQVPWGAPHGRGEVGHYQRPGAVRQWLC